MEFKKYTSGYIKESIDPIANPCYAYLDNTIRRDASVNAQGAYESLLDLAKKIDALSNVANHTNGIMYSKFTIGAFKALVDEISKDMSATQASSNIPVDKMSKPNNNAEGNPNTQTNQF